MSRAKRYDNVLSEHNNYASDMRFEKSIFVGINFHKMYAYFTVFSLRCYVKIHKAYRHQIALNV